MKKKLSVLLVSVLMVASVLGACGNKPKDSGKTEYKALYSSDVTTLNYLNTTYTNDMIIPANTQEWLIEYSPVGEIEPALAESWETSKDGLTWTFKLRDDVKWYNSSMEEMAPLVAQDFVNAAEYALKVDAGAAYLYPAAKIKNAGAMEEDPDSYSIKDVGVKAIDDTTLEFTLEAPCPYFLSTLTYGCFAPIATDVLKTIGDWDNRENWTPEEWASFSESLDAITYDRLWYCGAYYLNNYAPGEQYQMTKNPNYFEKDDVYIEKITNTYNAEASTISGEMYQRGEVEEASLDSTLAKSWSADEKTKNLFHPTRVLPDYSYFFSFEFDPKFDAAYEPENWKLAVNNENFRKSIFHGINRVGAKKISDEMNAEALLENTFTPRTFVAAGGTDYADQEIFKNHFANKDGADAYFNEDLAKEYRDKAKKELAAEGATFPIKVLMSYNPSVSDWDAECTYIEKQLEELLGTDYIDVLVVQGPSQSFLSEVRRANKFGLMKTNYGCDYADPLTYADPFSKGNSFGRMDVSTDPKTKKIAEEYYAAIKKADAVTDPDKTAERYEAFAEAESILIDHAIALPYGLEGGYTASMLNPFESEYAPYGVSTLKYKGMHILEAPLNTDEFNKELADWQKKVAAASK